MVSAQRPFSDTRVNSCLNLVIQCLFTIQTKFNTWIQLHSYGRLINHVNGKLMFATQRQFHTWILCFSSHDRIGGRRVIYHLIYLIKLSSNSTKVHESVCICLIPKSVQIQCILFFKTMPIRLQQIWSRQCKWVN